MAKLDFDARTVEPQKSFEPLPAGNYLAAISASEMKTTKTGDGAYLELTFSVIDGPCKGRKIWARLNLRNPNPQAVQIAKSELSAICHAVGVMTPRDSVELHNLPLIVTVKCKKREDNGDIVNEISGYKSRQAAAPKPVAAAPSAASPVPASDEPAPWA